MLKATEQRVLWEYYRARDSRLTDIRNKMGPYRKLSADDEIARYFDCSNYDTCLSHAANTRWATFTCEGCRKTQGLKVVEG